MQTRKVAPVTSRAAGSLSSSGTARRPALPAKGGGGAGRRKDEEQFSEKIRELIKMLPGLRAFHAYDSRRSWGPGFPDLVVAGPGGVLYRELKTPTGKVTPAQAAWLELLRRSGQDASVWRPAGLENGTIWNELRAITRKGGGTCA